MCFAVERRVYHIEKQALLGPEKIITENKTNRRTKAAFKCNVEDRNKIRHSDCILLVSVGQPYHEGDKFKATIELMNRREIKSCTVVVADSLQRHTLSLKEHLNKDESLKKSLVEGGAWIDRNIGAIQTLKMPYQITRWDEWLNHEKYPKSRMVINDLYQTEVEYRQAIHKTINNFLERYKKQAANSNFDYEKGFDQCLEYLKEECAIIIPLWSDYDYNFVIYPKLRAPAIILI